jgi:hypothetical protein
MQKHTRPQFFRFYIDLNICQPHIEAGSLAQTHSREKKLVSSRGVFAYFLAESPASMQHCVML